MLLVHYNFFPLSEAGVRRESVVAIEQNQGRMLLKGVSRQQNKLIVPSIFPYNKTAVRILGNLTPLERSSHVSKHHQNVSYGSISEGQRLI